jgi:murein DD-endopeptidase MepM/ murein hydrolase activator NlpD
LSEDGHSPVQNALVLKKNLEGIIDDLLDRKSEWDRKPTILPVDTEEYWISSGYGWRKSPFTGRREFHSGLDISSRRGTPIVAPADGTVISVGKDRYLGKFLKIAHSDNLTTIYGHLMEHKVKKGQPVKRGDLIGLMGNTGLSTGHHLHYQVQKENKSVNPKQYILNTRTSQTVLAKR